MSDPLLGDLESIEVEIPEADEIDDSLAIDATDYMQVPPEFGDFEVWCEITNDWVTVWRPGTDGPWFCRNCGKTDHPFRDHEGAGA